MTIIKNSNNNNNNNNIIIIIINDSNNPIPSYLDRLSHPPSIFYSFPHDDVQLYVLYFFFSC